MRILIITPRIPYPLHSGADIVTFNTIKYLSRRGHKFTLLSIMDGAPSHYDELKRWCEVHTILKNTNNSIWGAILNLFSKTPYTISKYQTPKLGSKIKKIIERKKIDIVHIEHLHMAYYRSFIRQGLPVFLRMHNVETTIMERFYRQQKNPLIKIYSFIQWRKLYRYERQVVEKFSRCIPITDVDKERLQSMNSKPVYCSIPAGVDISYFHAVDCEKEPYSIVFVGALDWLPNVDGICWFCKKVFPFINARVPEAKLYIVGRNPPVRIKKLEGKNVVVPGFVKDTREYLAKSNVSIVPLRTGSGMRIKILQALAMGIPVVSTSVGCEGIKVTNGREILIADEEERFAKSVSSLLQDEEYAKRLGKNGLKLVREKYSWEEIAKKFEGVYKC